MKRIDIFCASQASTAICSSMDQASSSSSSSSAIHLGGRAIDRHNPIIRDGRRSSRTLPTAPCSSHLPPINPKPYHQLQKPDKFSANKLPKDHQTKKGSAKLNNDHQKKKSSSAKKPAVSTTTTTTTNKKISAYTPTDYGTIRKSWAKPSDLITPPGSSRYLLSDSVFFNGFSDYDPVLALVPVEPKKSSQTVNDQDQLSIASKPTSSSSLPEKSSPDLQVVVLRVSLHCKGCEGKVRKHLSRMEGVTSFNIDFAAKKVTIIGDVTPSGVLESVSKVKSAQFWPNTMPSSSASAVASNNKEIKK